MWVCEKCNYSNGNSVDTCIKCQVIAKEEASKNKISSDVSDITLEVIKEKPKENKGSLFISLLVAFLTFIIVGIVTKFSDEPFVKIIPAVSAYLVFRLIRNKK
jgi:hypothetical protein